MVNRTKILLTGGSGFIGRNVLEILGEKYQFLAPTSKKLDLKNREAVTEYLEKNQPDIIIHAALAGEFKQAKKERTGRILADNLEFFFNLLRPRKFKKMIFFGSGAEYDKSRDLKKVKETSLGQSIPADEYSLYKYICSHYIEQTKNITCLTLFGVYGKYVDYRFKFISNAIVKNLFKQDIVINQNVVFDYLFIEDLISILDHFILNEPKFRNYNVTPNQSIDLVTICNIINEVSDFKSKIKVLKPGLNREYTGDNNRLKKEIPQLKFTSYKEGIRKLFKYYQKNLGRIDKKAIVKDEYLKSVAKKNKQ